MLLDIVILPPKKLRKKIGLKMSEVIRGVPHIFFVDNKRLVPHLSLFHIRTNKDRIKKLELRIKEILKKYRPFQIGKTRVEFYGRKTIGFRLSRSQRLKRLHEEMVFSCYNLRTGVMPWSGLSKLTTQKKDYRRKYGSSHLLKLFNPHFTVGLFRNEKDAQKVAAKLNKIKFQFLADTIAICEVNFRHQVTRVIKKYKI